MFESGAAQLSHRNLAEVTVPLCLNRDPFQYHFRGVAKAIRYNVNVDLKIIAYHFC